MRVKIGIVFLLLAFVLTITSKKVTTDAGAKAKPTGGTGKSVSSKITDVPDDQLGQLINDNEYLLVFFYDDEPSKVQLSNQVTKFD